MGRLIYGVCLLLGLVVMTWSGAASAQERCPFAVSGSITTGDPVQTGRLQTGTGSTCAAPRAVPSIVQANGSFRFDSYTVKNRNATSACVSITIQSNGGTVHGSAYLGSYDPANPQTNYLGDSGGNAQNGQSLTFSVNVPALANVVVVVHEVTGNQGATYQVSIADCGAVVVTSISPNGGPNAGGTSVTIKGSGFRSTPANPTVTIGGAATDVVVVDEATITAKTPLGQAAGPADVVVTNADTSSATLSGAFTYVAPAATQVVLASNANPSVFGQAVTFTATVSATGGTPTGNVAFKDGATTLGTVALNGAGVATFDKADLPVAAHAITAVYAGDATFATATSAVLTQTVGQAATSASIGSSKNPSPFGEFVTFSVSVTPKSPGGGTPTGTATFTADGVLLGSNTLDVVGKASFATAALGPGTHTIIATYEGSTSYGTSASQALVQTITGVAEGGTDAGSSSSSSSSSSSGSSSSSSGGATDAGVNPQADVETGGGGCDCRSAGGGSNGLAALVGAIAVMAIATRRKRR